MDSFTPFIFAESLNWRDYELVDSGDGLKLERFGPYSFVRPEVQALWKPALHQASWDTANAVFEPMSEESGGHWVFKTEIPERWVMTYPLRLFASNEVKRRVAAHELDALKSADLRFWVMTTLGRHLGVFPEAASNWDLIVEAIQSADRPTKVLNLFGYTGLGSLAAARAGAEVTHVDASKKTINWARENQSLSGLDNKPIRWIVDDALKFVQREHRRGVKYDGIILDPPKFGRGPKGEVWEVYKSLPDLLGACRTILSDHPLFVIVSVYAIRASAIHVGQALRDVMTNYNGLIKIGELITREKSAGRLLSHAVFARWEPLSKIDR